MISNSVYNGLSKSYTLDLTKGHTYWWRVRSKHAQSLGDWVTQSFTVELPAPDLIYPSHDTLGVPVLANLEWSEVENATEYDVQVSLSTDLQDLVYEANGVSETFTITDQLDYTTSYVWRARSKNDNSTSRWSEWAEFQTILPPPALVYPEDNSTAIPIDLTFRFETVDSAGAYYMQISKTEEFTIENIIFDSETDSDTSHFFDILDYQEDYFWRMRCAQFAENDEGDEVKYYSDWSSIRKYTTGIASPVLISPTNNQIDVTSSPRLIWEIYNDADSYIINVSRDEDFTELIYDDTLDVVEIEVSDLENYEVYYWRVQVLVGDEAGIWSDAWRFRTQMDQVVMLDEFCGSVDTKLKIRIDWESLKGAELYEIEVADNQSFLDAEVNQTGIELTNTIVDVTKYQTTYYARVRGYNEESTGSWSDPCSFTTAVNSVEDVLSNMNIKAYPNPFSETVTISFNMIEAYPVKLELFDMVGIKVYEKDLGTPGLGNVNLSISGEALQAGTYYYKLVVGDSEKTGEIVLVK